MKYMWQAMLDYILTRPSTTTDFPDEDPTIIPSDATFFSVEFVKDKYGIFNLSVINKGNASDLDIYYMKVRYLFLKLRALKRKGKSPDTPASKNLTSSFKAAKREFVKQLKRDFQDRHGQRQEF